MIIHPVHAFDPMFFGEPKTKVPPKWQTSSLILSWFEWKLEIRQMVLLLLFLGPKIRLIINYEEPKNHLLILSIYKLNNVVDRYWILTLRLKQERRHHAILLANLVDIGFAPVHVFHVARLFQTNASSVTQVYLGVVLSMNLPYWRALAAIYWFWLNVHLRKLRNTKSKQLKQLKCWTK